MPDISRASKTKQVGKRLAVHAKHWLLGASLGLGLGVSMPASAQDFPNKAIRLVVPYPAGGATDALARVLAPELSKLLSQNVYVENKGGGVSIIGTDLVATAKPDGYTLLMSDQALMTNPALQPKLPYDTLKDLQPVALIGPAPSVLVVNPSVPVHTIQELVALAKAKPGEMQYASSGNGTSTHIAGELLKQVAGIQMTHVSYKGGGPALNDVLAGHVPVLIASIGPAAPLIKAGKLRAIEVSSIKRSPVLPNVPTLAESGLGAAAILGYWGVLAPAKTPPAVISTLNGAFNKAIQLPDVRQRLLDLGIEPTGGTAEQFRSILQTEIPRMTRIVKSANITID
ncbi:tripartite tricarboxylate transporter substrate binding protein [Variovorax sp. LjRoot175]|uniref:tripartite tricarboxylate transporter substrate binding protein n=1 Tax=Variovorax sp. LjRoot175 TaxID=3342276 RepID=UPI003ECD8131